MAAAEPAPIGSAPAPGGEACCSRFATADAGLLHHRHWPALGPVPARAVLVLVHGLGGHGGRFAALAGWLRQRGYHVHAPDLPGHGLSPGPRGWVPAWSTLLGALLACLQHAERQDPAAAALPRFLLGHSMGGTLVLDLLLDRPELARGLILSNPALDANGVAGWRLALAHLLNRLWPRFTLATGFRLEDACLEPAACAELAADPLHHSRASARLACAFLDACAGLQRRAAGLRLPLLLLQSSGDRITPPAAARQLLGAVGPPVPQLVSYGHSGHELLHDGEWQQVAADLIDWLERHGG